MKQTHPKTALPISWYFWAHAAELSWSAFVYTCEEMMSFPAPSILKICLAILQFCYEKMSCSESCHTEVESNNHFHTGFCHSAHISFLNKIIQRLWYKSHKKSHTGSHQRPIWSWISATHKTRYLRMWIRSGQIWPYQICGSGHLTSHKHFFLYINHLPVRTRQILFHWFLLSPFESM